MNKISMSMKFLYVIKIIQFFFFTPLKTQLRKAEESKNEVKVLYLILAVKIVKLVLMIIITIALTTTITSALINIFLINNL